MNQTNENERINALEDRAARAEYQLKHHNRALGAIIALGVVSVVVLIRRQSRLGRNQTHLSYVQNSLAGSQLDLIHSVGGFDKHNT